MKKTFDEFLNSKGITADQFKAKNVEEVASLYNEYNDVVRTSILEAIEAKVSKEETDLMAKEFAKVQKEHYEDLTAKVKSIGLVVEKLKREDGENGSSSKIPTLRKQLNANLEKLKSLKTGGKEEVRNAEFTVKAAGDMLLSTNVSGGNVPVEQRIAGLNTIASRRVRLMDIISRGIAQSNVISWVYQAAKDGATGYTAEGALKNQIDFDLVVASTSVQKITAFIKLSTEMMDDVDFVESEIKNELMREMLKKVELELYAGAGGGSAINGIRTTATAFAAGTFATTVDNANEVDVLRVAMNQIKIADQDPANYILMHPSDVTKLKLIKVTSTDKRYIDQLQLVAGQLSLDGVPVIETTLVTAGQYLVGNFDLATAYDKGEMSISIGLDGNDFTKNMRTVLAEWRGCMVVKNNDRTAFVKGVFATDKTALETP